MNRPAAIGLIVILTLVIVVGKFHNRMFPRHAETEYSRVTVRVPSNWIYSKGDGAFTFQLVIPGSRLAEPAGFITARNLKTQTPEGYMAESASLDGKAKTAKRRYREAKTENGVVCSYTAKDKKREARAVEYIVNTPSGGLWHLVGVFDEKWYKKHGALAEDFVEGFFKENFGIKAPAFPEEKKPAGAKAEKPENKEKP